MRPKNRCERTAFLPFLGIYQDMVYRVNCDDTLRAIRDWI